MNIIQLTDTTIPELASFKKKEWGHADKEHYGEQLPDFSKNTYTFIAKEDDHIVGYITLTAELGVALVNSIIVGMEFRRRGIAKQLLTKAEEEAKKLGVHKIVLETGVTWSARYVYESMGYTIRCTMPNHYANQDFVLLDKTL